MLVVGWQVQGSRLSVQREREMSADQSVYISLSLSGGS
jgi:hypothetical protein